MIHHGAKSFFAQMLRYEVFEASDIPHLHAPTLNLVKITLARLPSFG